MKATNQKMPYSNRPIKAMFPSPTSTQPPEPPDTIFAIWQFYKASIIIRQQILIFTYGMTRLFFLSSSSPIRVCILQYDSQSEKTYFTSIQKVPRKVSKSKTLQTMRWKTPSLWMLSFKERNPHRHYYGKYCHINGGNTLSAWMWWSSN